MSREEGFRFQLAMDFAPLVKKLRISVFLSINDCYLKYLCRLVRSLGFSVWILRHDCQKTSVIIYNRNLMQKYLKRQDVQDILKENGYGGMSGIGCIRKFAKRYQAYMEKKGTFPHEMGIFLGYPPEDVRGYIENEGNNSLCTGYWKVYEDARGKKDLFDKINKAQTALVSLIMQGMDFGDAVIYMQ